MAEASTITKRGRAIATVGPAVQPAWESPEGMWIGLAEIVGDLTNDEMSYVWEVVRES